MLIKGEKPVSCKSCIMMYDDIPNCPLSDMEEKEIHTFLSGSIHPDCPIIGEITDKHGRIVDSSRIENFLTDWSNGKFDYEPSPDEALSVLLYSTPTILEASK